MNAYLIDSTARTITAVEYTGLADMQKMIGGYIEVAYSFPYGDILYVDEEGLLKGPEHLFWLQDRPDQPFAGNGVLVGREIGDTERTAPPRMSLEYFSERIRFTDINELRSSIWARRSDLGGKEE